MAASQHRLPPSIDLPDADAGTLRAALSGVQNVLVGIQYTVALLAEAEDKWRRKRDRARAELCRGQIIAYTAIADHVTEAIVDAFDLWQSYEAMVDAPDTP